MTRSAQFQRHGKGVFSCTGCDRSCRTVDQSEDSTLCQQCWELAGIENMVYDGYTAEVNWSEVDGLLEAAVKKGGDRAKIIERNKDLFDARPADAATAAAPAPKAKAPKIKPDVQAALDRIVMENGAGAKTKSYLRQDNMTWFTGSDLVEWFGWSPQKAGGICVALIKMNLAVFEGHRKNTKGAANISLSMAGIDAANFPE